MGVADLSVTLPYMGQRRGVGGGLYLYSRACVDSPAAKVLPKYSFFFYIPLQPSKRSPRLEMISNLLLGLTVVERESRSVVKTRLRVGRDVRIRGLFTPQVPGSARAGAAMTGRTGKKVPVPHFKNVTLGDSCSSMLCHIKCCFHQALPGQGAGKTPRLLVGAQRGHRRSLR